MSEISVGELLALRIFAQRTLGLLASTQADPNGFVRQQLDQALRDVDNYNITGDPDPDATRESARTILQNLFQGVLQPEPPRQ